jgi:hypothetical protein
MEVYGGNVHADGEVQPSHFKLILRDVCKCYIKPIALGSILSNYASILS